MVACEVGEYCTGKFQSTGALLCQGVRTHLHERIFAACVNHLCKQPVQRYCIRGCVGRWVGCSVNVVAHSRQQSATVSHLAEKLVEQGGNSGLAVGSCHTHQFQFLRWVAVECCGKLACNALYVGKCNIRNIRREFLWGLLAHYCNSAFFLGRCNVLMSVGLRSSYSDEHVTFLH